MTNCYAHVLIKHSDNFLADATTKKPPYNNSFLVDPTTKKPPSGELLENESYADAVARILRNINIHLNKPYMPDLLLATSEVAFLEVDYTYCFGLSDESLWVSGEELRSVQLYNEAISKLDTKPIQNADELLMSIKANMRHLERLLEDISDWAYVDLMYRLYHQSFKVYGVQSITANIIHWFRRVGHGLPLNQLLMDIVDKGTGKTFHLSHNQEWQKHTRPMIEAFLHAKYFLEMMVKYGNELDEDVKMMPSGYAAILYLYNMRF